MMAEARRGEEVIIAADDESSVKMTAVVSPVAKPRSPGRLKGQVELTEAFFEPLPDGELALWNGEGD